MNVTTGVFETSQGAKYLHQLCKHFAHEIQTACTETEGSLRFDMGTAFLSANATALTVRFELENDDAFSAAQQVIDRHLKRFAFREGFEHMDWDWTPPPTPRSVVRSVAGRLRQHMPGLYTLLRRAIKNIR